MGEGLSRQINPFVSIVFGAIYSIRSNIGKCLLCKELCFRFYRPAWEVKADAVLLNQITFMNGEGLLYCEDIVPLPVASLWRPSFDKKSLRFSLAAQLKIVLGALHAFRDFSAI